MSLLAYVERFRQLFVELYPGRRQLPFTPLNECGVPKVGKGRVPFFWTGGPSFGRWGVYSCAGAQERCQAETC